MFEFEKTDSKITRYRYERADGAYFLDIVETAEDFEFWLTAENNCYSSMCFGSPKEQHYACYDYIGETGEENETESVYTVSPDDFLDLVRKNVDEYIRDYWKDLDIFECAINDMLAEGANDYT